MRKIRHTIPLGLLALALSQPRNALAQTPSSTSGAFRANFALVDNARDQTLDGMGFQLGASIGRSLAPGLAWVGEVALTTVSHHAVAFPCAAPGCSNASGPSETSLSVAPGFQVNTTAAATKVAVTVTPGVLWFMSRPVGARALVPKLGAHLDVGGLLAEGPRIGLGVGIDWWGTDGTMPRWVAPFGLTIGVR